MIIVGICMLVLAVLIVISAVSTPLSHKSMRY